MSRSVHAQGRRGNARRDFRQPYRAGFVRFQENDRCDRSLADRRLERVGSAPRVPPVAYRCLVGWHVCPRSRTAGIGEGRTTLDVLVPLVRFEKPTLEKILKYPRVQNSFCCSLTTWTFGLVQ